MPPLACPNPPPCKRHIASAYLPANLSANRRCFAQDTLHLLTRQPSRHSQQAMICKRHVTPPTRPTAATANRRRFAKATCLRKLTQTGHCQHAPLRKQSMPPPTSTPPQKTHSFATNPHMQPQSPAALQKKHAHACLPTAVTANKRRFAKNNMPPPTHPNPPLRKLTQTGHRKQGYFAKSNMPPLTCPNPPPLTRASPQKQHAPRFTHLYKFPSVHITNYKNRNVNKNLLSLHHKEQKSYKYLLFSNSQSSYS